MRISLKNLFCKKSHFLTGSNNSSDFITVESNVLYSDRGRTYPRNVSDFEGDKAKRENLRLNPPAPDGNISVCAICSATMHWLKQYPHAHDQ